MKVLIFGATGMVGQGVLRECLLAKDVECVLSIARNTAANSHPKFREIIHRDFFSFGAIERELSGFDACFFCLGVSSVGMREAEYTRLTYDITLAAATILARNNPSMAFIYVSGAGTDGTERGSTMWARVKGKTENALRRLPFKAVYLFRPGIIQPLHGVRSKTPLYHAFYVAAKPLLWLMRMLAPASVVTTESVGRAMLNAVRRGGNGGVVEARDILELGKQQCE